MKYKVGDFVRYYYTAKYKDWQTNVMHLGHIIEIFPTHRKCYLIKTIHGNLNKVSEKSIIEGS